MNTTFEIDDPVKIVTGEHNGTEGAITDIIRGGYYVVKTVAGAVRLVDGFDIRLAPKVDYRHVPAFGLSSAQLAEGVAESITRATSRIVGVGNEQYAKDGFQRFEDIDLPDLYEMALEELDDVINYSVMIQIRIRRLLDSLQRRPAE